MQNCFNYFPPNFYENGQLKSSLDWWSHWHRHHRPWSCGRGYPTQSPSLRLRGTSLHLCHKLFQISLVADCDHNAQCCYCSVWWKETGLLSWLTLSGPKLPVSTDHCTIALYHVQSTFQAMSGSPAGLCVAHHTVPLRKLHNAALSGWGWDLVLHLLTTTSRNVQITS